MKRIKKGVLALSLLGFLLIGCTSTLPYRSVGVWNNEVRTLGPVSYCQGGGCGHSDEGYQWPVALPVPPSQDNITAALVGKASRQYHVSESSVVLKEITVKLQTEIVGTVRGWYATAIAGEALAASQPAKAPAEIH
jgi:hypothetical protein